MGGTGVVDRFLDVFTRYIDSGFGLLGGEVAFIATTLIVIDVTLAALFWTWGEGDDILARLIKKTLFVGVFAYIIGNWNSLPHDPRARQRGVGHQRQALARTVIDHRQDAEAPPVRQLVCDEVQRPALVGRQRQVQRSPRAHRSLPAAAPAHRQLLVAIDPLDPFPVDRMALAPQQHVQATIAEPSTFLGQGLQPVAQSAVVRARRLIAHARPIDAQNTARPPFAHLVGGLQMASRLAIAGGRHHFFPSRSFRATLSSIASASIRFSRAFSSSSALSRRASDTSSPPNLAFHL